MKNLASVFIAAILSVVAQAAPPEVVSVRQTLPPQMYEQIQQGLLPANTAEQSVDVGRYEKLELRVELKATYRNPYDPDDLDLWAVFTAPSGKSWKIWGFYNPSSVTTLWMVRFTPDETGTWKYIVKVRDEEGTAESKAYEVRVVPSNHRGFIHMASNRRYLQYSDGTPFYGVGLWYNDHYELFNQGSITEEQLDSLKLHGANFISFYNTPLETMGTGLGRYDSSRAGRLDEVFDWCEKRDIAISWNIWMHPYLSETVWSGNNRRYQHVPYNLITSAEQFYSNEEAWKYATKLHRYLVARWGYSRALFLWFIIDEADGTDGWVKSGSAVVEKWCQRVHDWLKANDPYQRMTTGTLSGAFSSWWPRGYQIFDIPAREIYEANGFPMPVSGKPDMVHENPLRISYLNYAKQSQDLWKGFHKPVIVGEAGGLHTYYEPGTPGYTEMYHNSLWTGLANGLSMTPFWWAYLPLMYDSLPTRSMTYFSVFVRDIDFAGKEWKPVTLKVSNGDGWAMQSNEMTFGWVASPVSGVANETFTVPDLEDGDYDVYLYHTYRGQYLEPITATSSGGRLTVKVPELTRLGIRANNIGNDVAFKIVKKGTAVQFR